MSLNRYEQTIFDYWAAQPDERRHWHAKIAATAGATADPAAAARPLERELWDYFVERSVHVAQFRALNAGDLRRISLLNLAEHLLRLWGPPARRQRPPGP